MSAASHMCSRCEKRPGVPYHGWGEPDTWCQPCLDERREANYRYIAGHALFDAIAIAAQAAMLAEEHGWTMPVHLERQCARCFECGATAAETALVRSSDGNWDCKDEWACGERARRVVR